MCPPVRNPSFHDRLQTIPLYALLYVILYKIVRIKLSPLDLNLYNLVFGTIYRRPFLYYVYILHYI